MQQELDLLIEDYLDGFLSPRETNRFERKLVRSDVQTAFAEALALRDLLRSAGPDCPPSGLMEQIEETIITARPKKEKRTRWFGATRTALSGMTWAVRGPALALSSQPTGTRETLSGLGTIRYTLGPLTQISADAQDKPRRRSGWFRRVIGLGRKRA